MSTNKSGELYFYVIIEQSFYYDVSVTLQPHSTEASERNKISGATIAVV